MRKVKELEYVKKTFVYNSQHEMDAHIKNMTEHGWTVYKTYNLAVDFERVKKYPSKHP